MLGGWHQIWPEDDFYLPLEIRLASSHCVTRSLGSRSGSRRAWGTGVSAGTSHRRPPSGRGRRGTAITAVELFAAVASIMVWLPDGGVMMVVVAIVAAAFLRGVTVDSAAIAEE